MAAILKLRRGTSFSSPQISEPFFDTSRGTLLIGTGSNEYVTLARMSSGSDGKINEGSFWIDGDVTASNLNLSGDITARNTTLSGDIIIGGNIYLGNEVADNIIVQASLSGSLIPSSSAEYDLGSELRKWNKLWVVSASFDDVSVPGSGILSSSVTDFTTYSSSIDSRLDSLEGDTGSYATTGSNLFLGHQQITGSLKSSGSVEFQGIPWPSVGNETHLFKTDGYIVNAPSGDRTYDYFGIALEQISTSSYYENSLLFYTYDDHNNPTYGNELLVSPLKSHMRITASGSQTLGNVSVSDLLDGTTIVNLYGSQLHLGAYLADTILLGNTGSYINVKGTGVNVETSVTASYFVGDGRHLSNVTASYVEYDNVVNKPTLVSGSSQIDVNNTENFQTFSQSVDSRLDTLENTFSESVDVRLDNLEWTGSNHEDRLDELEGSFSQSVDLRLDYLEGSFSESIDLRLDNAEWTGSDHESRLDTIEGSFSQSVDLRLDNLEWTGSDHESRLDELENSFSESIDLRLDNLEWTGSNHEDRIVELEATGSNHASRLVTLETTFSESVDLRLDNLESSLDAIEEYTSSLKNAIEVNGTDLIVLGNLTVQGTQTFLNTTEVLVEDKLLALASGSTTSGQADGGGIYISGADASMTWNHTDQLIEFNTKVSSSVGFKGDGSELTNIQHENVVFDGSGIVSGSDQVSGSIYGDVSGDITINNLGVASISTGVIVNSDVKSDAGIVYTKLNLNGSNIVSSSLQISGSIYEDISGDITIDNLGVASISTGVIINTDVKSDAGIVYTKLNLNGSGIVSGSSQIDADFVTNFDTNVKDKINLDNVHSGSYLGTATTTNLSEGDNLYYTDARVKTKLNAEGVISGSDQVSGSLDDRYLQIDGDSVVSSSDQVSSSLYSGLSGVLQVSPFGSAQIVDGSITNLDINTNAGIVYTKITFDGSNIISGSDQVTQSLDLLYEEKASGTHTLISSSNFSSTNQGKLTATINGLDSDVDLGLEVTDSPEFAGLTLTGLSSLGSSDVNAIISGSGGVLGYRALGTAAFFNVSASVGDDPNSIPTNQAVSDALIAAGAGDITAINDSTLYTSDYLGLEHTGEGTLNGGYGQQGNVVIALATGSVRFTEGVVKALPTGVVSGSAQLTNTFLEINGDNVFSSSTQVDADSITNFDTNVKDKLNADGVISGSAQVLNGTGIVSSSTQISGYNKFLEINGDNVVSGSSQISMGGDLSGTANNAQIIAGAITNNEVNITAGIVYTKLNLQGSGIISSSAQVNADSITNFDSNVKAKMNADGVISGSSQIIGGSGIVSSSEQISGYNTFLEINGDNVFSSSTQVNADSITNFDTNVKSKMNADGVISGSSQIINGSGIVSSSQQISDYNTFLEINGMGVISGSDQLTGSLVTLDTDQTISGTKTFNDIVVNGTGSFAYITSVTGTVKIIGDSHVVVNSATPTSRYAGISVYDSGSTLSTASFQFDGQTNDWHYEYSSSAGIDYGVAIFGPEYNTKGNPTYLTSNRIPKSDGTHHLNDSNITDTGTLITLGSNTKVTGTFVASGTPLVSGSSQVTLSGDITGPANNTAIGTGVIVNDDVNASAGITYTKLNLGGSGIVSGSAGLTLAGDVTGAANSNTVGKIQGVAITSAEANQLANINTTTISTTQWGYVGALNQGLTQTSNVKFANISGSAIHSEGNITSEADIIAYASSDRRLKDEIQPIENSLEKINQIGGYSFVWNTEKQNIYKGKDYGVIAQEIEQILPELVDTRENGYKAVKYDRLVSLLIEGIKELSKEVDELKNKLG